MTSAVTYEGALARSQPVDVVTPASLFAGQKLWFSQTVPQRNWLIQNAELNGACVTKTDVQADVILYDHARRNVPPGSFSYRYVEFSIRKGALENLEDHRITSDSRADRPVGSVKTASKGSRNAYTDEEDQLLWNWVKPYMDAGGSWKGNEIYKQLERLHPRHTFQSWRDRWIKHTQYQNRQITARVEPPPPVLSSHTEQSEERAPKRRRITTPVQDSQEAETIHTQEVPAKISPSKPLMRHDQPVAYIEPTTRQEQEHEQSSPDKQERDTLSLDRRFSQKDIQLLFNAAPNILIADTGMLDRSWVNVAEEYPHHSSAEWRSCFEDLVVPEYLRRKGITTDDELDSHILELIVEFRAEQARQRSKTTIVEDMDNSTSLLNDRNRGIEGIVLQQLAGRPPEPNESRKRSQGRSTQSDSIQSQSNSQSQMHSQISSRLVQSQNRADESQDVSNASLPDIAYRTDPATLLGSVQTSPTMVRTEALSQNSNLSRRSKQHADRDKDPSIKPEATPQSKRTPGRFFLDVEVPARLPARDANNRQKSLPVADDDDNDNEDNDVDDEEDSDDGNSDIDSDDWIPPRARKDSPMFFPDESEDIRDDGVSNSGTNELMSQPDQQNTGATLSQQFETAPQTMRGARFLSQSSLDDHATRQSPSQEAHEDPNDQGGEELGFETAPTQLHTSNQLSNSMTEDFTIPPPEGGWSDDESEEMGAEAVNQTFKQTRREDQLSARETLQSKREAHTDDDMESWLSIQKHTNSDIDDIILDEICIKALEATSLQLDVASLVVEALVTTYQKGKHQAIKHISNFLDETGHLRSFNKRESKEVHAAISRMVDDLMLRDQKGVWTKSDDRKLMSENARSVKEVELKHGDDGVRLRFEYLEQLFHEV